MSLLMGTKVSQLGRVLAAKLALPRVNSWGAAGNSSADSYGDPFLKNHLQSFKILCFGKELLNG